MAENSNFDEGVYTDKNNENVIRSRSFVWGDISSKSFWKRNIIPVFLEIGFLISCFSIPKAYIIYSNFIFLGLLFIYFLISKTFSFKDLWRNFSSGFHFWRNTIICALLFVVAIFIIPVIGLIFPNIRANFYPLNVTNKLTLVLFALIFLVLKPIAEETFFRGCLISFETKSMMILTSVASIFLFAITHSFSLWGIISAAILAVPLTLVFLKTRNFYITMTAHFIVNLLIYIPQIVNYL